jgi:hypothetical protein
MYGHELIKLDPSEYKNVEAVSCYIDEEQQEQCIKIIKELKNTKSLYVAKKIDKNKFSDYTSCGGITYSRNHILKHLELIGNFGYKNYLSNDKKTLIISELSLCKTRCNNCMPCLQMEYLEENSQIETLIINKLGYGANAILNNLPYSLIQLRVLECEEVYNLTNLPFSLQKLELYDQKTDCEKIKLPIDCVITLI